MTENESGRPDGDGSVADGADADDTSTHESPDARDPDTPEGGNDTPKGEVTRGPRRSCAGGTEVSRSEMRLIERAAREGWNIDEQLREDTVRRVAGVLRGTDNEGRILRAAMTLGYLDSLNVRRERTAVQDKAAEGQQVQQLIRTLLQTPQGLAALASINAALAEPPPADNVR